MAPRFPDDHQDEGQSRQPDDVPEDESTNRRSGDESRGSAEPVDFGAFVSRSVRSSADRFRKSDQGERGSEEGATIGTRPERDAPEPPPRKRSPRYWRDSLREKGGTDAPVRRYKAGQARDDEDDDGAVVGGGGGRGDVPIWGRYFGGGDGEGPDRRMLGYALIALIILVLLIFGLIRLFGGDDDENGDEPTETPVSTQVLPPGGDAPGTPEEAGPTEPPVDEEPTATSEIRRGGDNQLGGDDDDDGTPEARAPAPESEIAGQCTDRCLVRVESDNIANTLEETGNRPSFSGDGIAWVVATPDQVAFLDDAADVDLVRDSDETLSLYMLTVPEGGNSALAQDYGEVVDSAGAYQLVDFNDVPARVTTLIDNGFIVNKVTPPPSDDPVVFDDRTPVGEVSGGTLMGQVSETNIWNTISALQQTNAPDGSELGSRYYTLPGNQVAADYLFRQLESYGLEVWYEDVLTPEGILLVNVVAEAPGVDDSAVYAVMAHLDSINSDDPRVAPGADDNGSGMAATLEIARILAQYELRHPVRFVFVNAEEVGILGATAWARQANANGVQVDGVYNVDSVGSSRQGRLMVLNSDASSQWLQDVLIETNQAYGLGQEILSRQNPVIVADDNMVRAEGIDAVMVARELYGWTSIHHSADDVTANVSVDNVLTTTYLVLLAVVQLAGS